MKIDKQDLSGAEALYGLYYMAVASSDKVIDLSFQDIESFVQANAERNKTIGVHAGMVNSCHGYFIGVNVAHAHPDVTEYDQYYGYGTAAKALNFARAMKRTKG